MTVQSSTNTMIVTQQQTTIKAIRCVDYVFQLFKQCFTSCFALCSNAKSTWKGSRVKQYIQWHCRRPKVRSRPSTARSLDDCVQKSRTCI
eukprot:6225295-Amphidinium_carterae.1